MYTRTLLCSLFVLAICQVAFASLAYSQLDPTFGSGGIATILTPELDLPLASFLMPDGKILVINGHSYGSADELLRFNVDGRPDPTFGVGGRIALSIPPAYILRAIRQTDGKIVLVGGSNNDSVIIRINEDGALDQTFSEDGVHRPNLDQLGTDYLTTVFQQADGKLVAAGAIRVNNGFSLIRYLPNGEPDTTFGDQEGYIIYPDTCCFPVNIAPQFDGKFLLFGQSVYRFNPDGQMDLSFNVPTTEGSGSFMLGNKKFLIYGTVETTDSLFRVHSDLTIRR